MTDITMHNDGSLIGFQLHTLAARQWFQENVGSDGWQWMGTTLWVDRRYAQPIADGLAEAGLNMES
jgi:hypothetical protein